MFCNLLSCFIANLFLQLGKNMEKLLYTAVINRIEKG